MVTTQNSLFSNSLGRKMKALEEKLAAMPALAAVQALARAEAGMMVFFENYEGSAYMWRWSEGVNFKQLQERWYRWYCRQARRTLDRLAPEEAMALLLVVDGCSHVAMKPAGDTSWCPDCVEAMANERCRMSADERHDLFGDPSDYLVPEAVWVFRQENEDWPLWEEALQAIARVAECDEEEADARLCRSIRDGEVLVQIRGGTAGLWGVALDEAVADRIARRYMDLTMPRQDREETW